MKPDARHACAPDERMRMGPLPWLLVWAAAGPVQSHSNCLNQALFSCELQQGAHALFCALLRSSDRCNGSERMHATACNLSPFCPWPTENLRCGACCSKHSCSCLHARSSRRLSSLRNPSSTDCSARGGRTSSSSRSQSASMATLTCSLCLRHVGGCEWGMGI